MGFCSGPTGLGTAAAWITPGSRLGLKRLKPSKYIPYQKAGPVRLPEFYMPFKPKTNPHLEAARKKSKEWARQMGMLEPLPDHPGIFIFDEHRFDVTDLVFFCAQAHPEKTAAALDLETCWIVWGTYTDDYIPAIYGRTHDLAGAKQCHARLSAFMPDELSAMPIPQNPVERGLVDMWPRSTATLSINERRLFRRVIERMVGSWVWEIADRIQNRILDPVGYVEMRRITSGSDQILLLSRSIYGEGIPPEVHRTLTMQELNNATIDYVCMTNDIASYQKEVEFDGEIHNAVLVIRHFLGCDSAQAVDVVNKLMTSRMKQFEHIVAVELPVLFENFNLDARAQAQLYRYVEQLQNYMCASLHWHIRTGRYSEIEFARRSAFRSLIRAPTQLGTSAARILETIGRQKKEVEAS
jgi:germacradienol/geosmin synthase